MKFALLPALPTFSDGRLISCRINTYRPASKQATSTPLDSALTQKPGRGCHAPFPNAAHQPWLVVGSEEAACQLFPHTLFKLSSIISILTKKHPGYGGLYLQTPVRKRWVPKVLPISELRPPSGHLSHAARPASLIPDAAWVTQNGGWTNWQPAAVAGSLVAYLWPSQQEDLASCDAVDRAADLAGADSWPTVSWCITFTLGSTE